MVRLPPSSTRTRSITPLKNNGLAKVSKLDANTKDKIVCALPSLVLDRVLGGYLSEFHEKYPGVKLNTYHFTNTGPFLNNSPECYERIKQDKIDFVIDVDYACFHHGLNVTSFISPQIILIASKAFLAKNNLGTTISKEQFIKLPVVGSDDLFQHQFRSRGIPINDFVTTADFAEVYGMVKSGAGIGLHLREFVALEKCECGDEVVEIKVAGINHLQKFSLVFGYKQDIRKAPKAFIDGAVEYIKKLLK